MSSGLDDDDEFDDLFSFSATSPQATTIATAISSSPIDFGIEDDDDDNGIAPSMDRDDMLRAISPSNKSDVPDDIFGNVIAVATSPEPFSEIFDIAKSAGRSSSKAVRPRLPSQQDDDFHVHDAGTRDFLEWLDDTDGETPVDGAPKLENLNVSTSDDDDGFDFDKEILGNVSTAKTGLKDEHNTRLSVCSHDSFVDVDVSGNDPLAKGLPQTEHVPTLATKHNPRPVERSDPALAIRKDDPTKSGASLQTSFAHMKPSNFLATNSLLQTPTQGPISLAQFTEETEEDNALSASSSQRPGALLEEHTKDLPPSPTPSNFKTLSQSVRSSETSMDHIRFLLNSNSISNVDRPHLWCKALCCGRVLEDVQSGSVADSFHEWNKGFDIKQCKESGEFDASLLDRVLEESEMLAIRVLLPTIQNAPHLVETKSGTAVQDGDNEVDKDALYLAQQSLCSLLLFHYSSGTKSDRSLSTTSVTAASAENGMRGDDANKKVDEKGTVIQKTEWDPLLGPVAAMILAAGLPTIAASVMLSNIVPVAMPLMALNNMERFAAAKKLHSQLYLLTCYHLPLLVYHLDRYASGWHWPKKVMEKHVHDIILGEREPVFKDDNDVVGVGVENATKKGRDLESHGAIRLSWFASHLAGECGTTTMDPNHLMCLWDVLLTSEDNALKFFLALAVLEKHSDTLLMLRDQELVDELTNVMQFKETGVEREVFVGEDDDDDKGKNNSCQGNEYFVCAWCDRAKALQESTPRSVVDTLRKAEDEAVNHALLLRQKTALETMKVRLESEAQAHRAAMEADRAVRDEEARLANYKERLLVYYKKHNPERVNTVDKIFEVYDGRLELLDARLKAKYGSGFLPTIPVINPNLSAKTNKLLSTMGHGIQSKRKEFVAARAEREAKRLGDGLFFKNQVTVKVSAEEVVPVLCISKASKEARGELARLRHYGKSANNSESLRYFVVDSRPDETASEQGRFPTAVRLSPEALMDPDRIQQQVEMFESLRSAAHICIMGEGFSAFPNLYGQALNAKEQKLLQDDEARTSLCALFFVKKGFPFVSTLDGGFAAAHAWLARNGKSNSLNIASVLVDYDEDVSLFAQLEKAYQDQQAMANASTREKTTLVLQKLIDNSMTRLSASETKIENFTSDMRSQEGRQKVKESVTKLFAKPPGQQLPKTETLSQERKTQTEESGEAKSFKLPFLGLNNIDAVKENAGDDPQHSLDLNSGQARNPFASWKASLESRTAAPSWPLSTTRERDLEKQGDDEKAAFDYRLISFAPFHERSASIIKTTTPVVDKETEASDIEATAKDAGGVTKRNIFAKLGSAQPCEKTLEQEVEDSLINPEAEPAASVFPKSTKFGGISFSGLTKAVSDRQQRATFTGKEKTHDAASTANTETVSLTSGKLTKTNPFGGLSFGGFNRDAAQDARGDASVKNAATDSALMPSIGAALRNIPFNRFAAMGGAPNNVPDADQSASEETLTFDVVFGDDMMNGATSDFDQATAISNEKNTHEEKAENKEDEREKDAVLKEEINSELVEVSSRTAPPVAVDTVASVALSQEIADSEMSPIGLCKSTDE